jgi:hypothetical protein
VDLLAATLKHTNFICYRQYYCYAFKEGCLILATHIQISIITVFEYDFPTSAFKFIELAIIVGLCYSFNLFYFSYFLLAFIFRL